MDMDITTLPQYHQVVKSEDVEKAVAKNQAGGRLCSKRPSTSMGFTNPHQRILESSLKRSVSASELKTLSQAPPISRKDIQPKALSPTPENVTRLEEKPTTCISHDPAKIETPTTAHSSSDLADAVTLTENDAVQPSTHANNDNGATSQATTPSPLEKDDTTAQGLQTQIPSAAPAAPDTAKSPQAGAGPPATEQNILPTEPPSVADLAAEEWRSPPPNLPTAAPMATVSSPGAPPDQRGSEDPDAISAAASGTFEGNGVIYEGNLVTVNDVPVGRETGKLDVPPTAEEVKKAREDTQEGTAERQQLALAKDRKLRKKRYFFHRLWKKFRSKGSGTTAVGQ